MAQGPFANRRSVRSPIRQKQMLKICGKCDLSLWFPFTGLIQQIAGHSNVLTCLRRGLIFYFLNSSIQSTDELMRWQGVFRPSVHNSQESLLLQKHWSYFSETCTRLNQTEGIFVI